MQPTVESLQGELLALRCHLGALAEMLPLSQQLRFRAKLETCGLLLRPNQPGERQAAFDRATNSLAAKRLRATLCELDRQDQGAGRQ